MEVRVEDYQGAVSVAAPEGKPKPRAKKRAPAKRTAAPKKTALKTAEKKTPTPRKSRTSHRSVHIAALAPPPEAPDEKLRIIDVIDAGSIAPLPPLDAPPPAVLVEAEEVAIEALEDTFVPPAPQKRVFVRRRVVIPLVVASLALAASVGAYVFLGASSAPQTLTEAEVQKIIAEVGELIILPADETPLVASVVNAELLRATESFYRHAQDGNILLLYTESGRAILYDRERDIIVNIGTLQNPPAAGE